MQMRFLQSKIMLLSLETVHVVPHVDASPKSNDCLVKYTSAFMTASNINL